MLSHQSFSIFKLMNEYKYFDETIKNFENKFRGFIYIDPLAEDILHDAKIWADQYGSSNYNDLFNAMKYLYLFKRIKNSIQNEINIGEFEVEPCYTPIGVMDHDIWICERCIEELQIKQQFYIENTVGRW